MTGIEKVQRAFRIYVEKPSNRQGIYRVLFHPRSLQQAAAGGIRRKVPDPYIVEVSVVEEEVNFSSSENPPTDPEADEKDFNLEAHKWVALLQSWLTRLNALLKSVELIAGQSGWQTRIVEKKMEDSEIGIYRAPALKMQADAVQLLLDPIARVTPGGEGVADLYVVPAYDDIATFVYYEDRWHLHNPFTPASVGASETRSLPASEENIRLVLDEMKRDAR